MASARSRVKEGPTRMGGADGDGRCARHASEDPARAVFEHQTLLDGEAQLLSCEDEGIGEGLATLESRVVRRDGDRRAGYSRSKERAVTIRLGARGSDGEPALGERVHQGLDAREDSNRLVRTSDLLLRVVGEVERPILLVVRVIVERVCEVVRLGLRREGGKFRLDVLEREVVRPPSGTICPRRRLSLRQPRVAKGKGRTAILLSPNNPPERSGFWPEDDDARREPTIEPLRDEPAEDPRRDRTLSPNSSASLKIRFSNYRSGLSASVNHAGECAHLLDVGLHLDVRVTA